MKLGDLYKLGGVQDFIVFGTGYAGEAFWEKYNARINIPVCYDNAPKKEFHGIPVIKPEFKKSDCLIVICTVNAVEEMSSQLQKLGYRMFENFITIFWFEYFMEQYDPGKETVLFYGTCHSNMMVNAMRRVPEFYTRYNSIHVRVNSEDPIDIALAEIAFNECSAVIYNQYVGNVVDQRQDLIVPKISFPTLQFWTYWPQTDLHKVNPFYIPGLDTDDMLARADVFINSMILQGKSEDEIMSYIMSDQVISKEKVLRLARINFAQNKLMDRLATVKISDLIEENYDKRVVYHDYFHMQDWLIWEYAKRILNYMGINSIHYEEDGEYPYTEMPVLQKRHRRSFYDKEIYSHTQIPIYPCVAEYLNLEMIDQNTKYRVVSVNRTKNWLEPDQDYWLTFEEYESMYIRRCQKIVREREWIENIDLEGVINNNG